MKERLLDTWGGESENAQLEREEHTNRGVTSSRERSDSSEGSCFNSDAMVFGRFRGQPSQEPSPEPMFKAEGNIDDEDGWADVYEKPQRAGTGATTDPRLISCNCCIFHGSDILSSNYQAMTGPGYLIDATQNTVAATVTRACVTYVVAPDERQEYKARPTVQAARSASAAM
eukprot:Skav205358  [mRNA]  locus=scaffold1956:192274:198777:- [translate_table: standard]